jgi:ribosomal protein L37AE/L43A
VVEEIRTVRVYECPACGDVFLNTRETYRQCKCSHCDWKYPDYEFVGYLVASKGRNGRKANE